MQKVSLLTTRLCPSPDYNLCITKQQNLCGYIRYNIWNISNSDIFKASTIKNTYSNIAWVYLSNENVKHLNHRCFIFVVFYLLNMDKKAQRKISSLGVVMYKKMPEKGLMRYLLSVKLKITGRGWEGSLFCKTRTCDEWVLFVYSERWREGRSPWRRKTYRTTVNRL